MKNQLSNQLNTFNPTEKLLLNTNPNSPKENYSFSKVADKVLFLTETKITKKLESNSPKEKIKNTLQFKVKEPSSKSTLLKICLNKSEPDDPSEYYRNLPIKPGIKFLIDSAYYFQLISDFKMYLPETILISNNSLYWIKTGKYK